MRLAVALDQRMTAEGRKNTWLADQLGVSKATVGRLRSGAIEISVDRARELEQVLGMEPGDLLREAGYFEHIVPQSQGGSTSAENLVAISSKQNAVVTARQRQAARDEAKVAAKSKRGAKPARGKTTSRPHPPAEE